MDLSWEVIALATITIYVAEIFGSVVGGGGFLVQPVLILLGIPVHVAVANDIVACLGSDLGAIPKLKKHGYISWQQAIWMIPGAIIGGYTGSQLLQYLEPTWIEKIIGVFALLMVSYTLLSTHDGTRPHPLPRHWRPIAVFLSLIIGLHMGISGAGTGTLAGIALVSGLGLTHLQSLGTRLIFLGIANLAAAFGYLYSDLIIWQLVLPMFLACILAGWTGSHIALKLGDLWLKRVLTIMIVALAIWLLLK